jgi:hypothetical protein
MCLSGSLKDVSAEEISYEGGTPSQWHEPAGTEILFHNMNTSEVFTETQRRIAKQR